ncbi:MAG: hypothetical protein ACXWT1_04100 [Methylobacter sp.]
MSNFTDEYDIDKFLKEQMSESDVQNVSSSSSEQLESGWQTGRAQCSRIFDQGGNDFSSELISPLAASDGSPRDRALCCDSIGGEWSLSRETIPAEPDRLMLRFQCRDEFIQEYRDRQVQIIIGKQIFDLGKVDRRGTAESKVSSGLDLRQTIDVRIMERQSGGEETK